MTVPCPPRPTTIFILTDDTLWPGPRKSQLAGRPDVVAGTTSQ